MWTQEPHSTQPMQKIDGCSMPAEKADPRYLRSKVSSHTGTLTKGMDALWHQTSDTVMSQPARHLSKDQTGWQLQQIPVEMEGL